MLALQTVAASLSNRYRVERELGHGGAATVYLAEDLKHGRKVAIKVFDPQASSQITAERFAREIEIAARLAHPHILPLHDSGATGAALYYAMPYVEGGSLRERMDREGQLPYDDASRLACEIASALGHAHRQGVVHRDIKPENVLLSDGIALVADFGIARMVETTATAHLTRTGTVLGTPVYMSPEQAMGSSELDARSDLYSLGCVVYEMLGGEPPFTGPNVPSVLAKHAFEAVPSLRARRPALPEAIEQVVMKALAKAPADRYENAARFAEALALASTGMMTALPTGLTTSTPHNLPGERTSFVGRDRELAECSRLLGETRHLTLTGLGGCGKTRLALQLAARLLERFPDGVWFVDLAPVSEGSRVPQAAAVTLGVREEAGQSLAQTLGRHIGRKRMLLVLDNCEHVLEASGSLVDTLLASAPDLKVLGTSREGLGLNGEREFAVLSLSLPSAATTWDLRAIEASDAVQLFVARARVVDSEFRLSEANGRIVADICRRVDGIPLAVELAATRVKMLSVEQIQSKLDHRFQFLTGGNRALPRHQTLWAALAWSYDHLTAKEQELFRKLSVFAGSWTLEATTALAGTETDEFEVLHLLTQLVDKSLVGVEHAAARETRYCLLETVRQYASELLDRSGERDETRDRHLEHFIAWAERHEPMFSSQQAEWLIQVGREHDNVLAALDSCSRATVEAEKSVRLAGAIWMYWHLRGLVALGRKCLADALERLGAGARTRVAAKALFGAARLAWSQGAQGDARKLFQESLTICGALQDPAGMSRALNGLGFLLVEQKDLDSARACFKESLALAREAGDQGLITTLLNNLAESARQQGDHSASRRLHAEALASARTAGIRNHGLAVCLTNLALDEIQCGELDPARARLTESLRLVLELDAKVYAPVVLDAVVALAEGLGEPSRAARWYGAAGTLWKAMGTQRDLVDEQTLAPILAWARQALGEETFASALGAGSALAYENAMKEALAWLG